MALPVSNTLEGGTNGTTVTSLNSGGASGTALDDLATDPTCTLTFDNSVTLVQHGSMALQVTTGGTAGDSFAGWTNTTTGTSAGAFSGRFYFRTGTLGVATASRIFACSSAVGVICFTLILTKATMIINVNDTTGTNIGSTGSAISSGVWYRIEYQCTPSTTTGQVLVRIYQGDSNVIFTSITTASNVNLGGTNHFGADRYGVSGGAVANAGPYFYDDMMVVAGSTWLGSSVVASPSVLTPKGRRRSAMTGRNSPLRHGRIASPIPPQQVVTVPAPLFVIGSRRRAVLRRTIRLNPSTANLTGSPLIPPGPRRSSRAKRFVPSRSDGDSFQPPFPQTAPVNPLITGLTTGRIRRAALRLRRPSSVPEPLPAQVIVTGAPAITQTTTARVRRALASYRRRAALGGPVAPQDELPGATTRRRLSITSARRRAATSPVASQDPFPRAGGRLRTVGRVRPPARVSNPVSTQQAVTPNPGITATVFGRLRTVGRIQPRGKVSTKVPPQFNPPIVQTVFGRLRTVGRIRPRTKVVSPTQAQQPVTPNPAITATVFGRLRTVGRVRPPARVSNPVPAQQAVTATVFGRLRTVGRIQPRGKVSTKVPPQFNPPIVQTVFGRLRTVGRVRPRTKVVSPTQAQQPVTPNPAITATVFGRLRTVGRVRPSARIRNPVPAQTATPNPAITATVFGRLRTVGRVRPRTKAVTPVPPQPVLGNLTFGRLRLIGRTNRIPRVPKPIPPQANPIYPIRPGVGGLSGLRRLWLKVRRKNAYPVPPQVTTLQGPLTITDSHGGVEADRTSGTVIGGTYGSSASSTVSKGASGGFTADPDNDNVVPTYDSDSDSL